MVVLPSIRGVGFPRVFTRVRGIGELLHNRLIPIKIRKSQGPSADGTSDFEQILPEIQITKEEITVEDSFVELGGVLIGTSGRAVKPDRRSNAHLQT